MMNEYSCLPNISKANKYDSLIHSLITTFSSVTSILLEIYKTCNKIVADCNEILAFEDLFSSIDKNSFRMILLYYCLLDYYFPFQAQFRNDLKKAIIALSGVDKEKFHQAEKILITKIVQLRLNSFYKRSTLISRVKEYNPDHF